MMELWEYPEPYFLFPEWMGTEEAVGLNLSFAEGLNCYPFSDVNCEFSQSVPSNSFSSLCIENETNKRSMVVVNQVTPTISSTTNYSGIPFSSAIGENISQQIASQTATAPFPEEIPSQIVPTVSPSDLNRLNLSPVQPQTNLNFQPPWTVPAKVTHPFICAPPGPTSVVPLRPRVQHSVAQRHSVMVGAARPIEDFLPTPCLTEQFKCVPPKKIRKDGKPFKQTQKRKKVSAGPYLKYTVNDMVLYQGPPSSCERFNSFIDAKACYQLPGTGVFLLLASGCPAKAAMASVQRYLNRQKIFGREYSYYLRSGNLLCVPRD